MTPNAKTIIARKRDGHELLPEELEFFVRAAVRGDVPDYQVTAWLMAVYFQGMTPDETANLTRSMIDTGDRLPRVSEHPLPVDKHSTGGVGDKLSFLVAPLVAAAGGRVPMISGRSLGHTGGTLDKLESIPGYRTALPPDEFLACVREVGVSIAGQSERMVPADRLFYSLRDAASIVESIPLITASILSKKVAEGAGALVLDVKVGSGAFMTDPERAEELASWLVGTAGRLGLRARAYLTDMDHVLGRTAGNALEMAESIRALADGPDGTAADLRELTLVLGASMLELSGVVADPEAAATRIETVWRSGDGLRKLREMVVRQGGEGAVIDDPARLPRADRVVDLPSPESGTFRGLEARAVGDWITESGGGRLRAGDRIDPRVGLEIVAAPGDGIERGETVARLHLGKESVPLDRAQGWIRFGPPGPTLVRAVNRGEK